MGRTRSPMQKSPVSIEVDGQTHTGSYYIESGCITVRYGVQEKTTQVGGHAMYEEGLARLLMHEMVREEKAA